jgi:cytochrome P450
LLREPRLVSPSIIETLRQLEQRYALELPNLIFAARFIPLLNEGATHLELRRAMSRLLTAARERMQGGGADLMEQCFARLHSQEEVDLVEEVLAPLVRDFFTRLIGAAEPVPFSRLVITIIFDKWASLKALRAAEAEIAAQRQVLKGSAASEWEEGVLLALLILGRDSLLATLADSTREVLAANPGRRLDQIDYPKFPTETGVAIAEREVSENFAYEGVEFPKGDWLRLYFHGVTHGPGRDNHTLMFGAGAHACLGRHLSLDLWQRITRQLGSVPRRAEITGFSYCGNHVFVMPKTLRLRLD